MNDYPLFNRELSWLSFNHRVLQEAKDPSVPLYDRIKFLAIFSSNLDEFFRVRVASIRSLLALKKKTQKKLTADLAYRKGPELLLKKIYKKVNKLQDEFGNIFRNEIIPELNKNNICLINENGLLNPHEEFVTNYFREEIKPNLHPVFLIRKAKPVFLKNKAIYLAVELLQANKNKEEKKSAEYAILEIPSDILPRFIQLPEVDEKKYVIFLDDLIRICLSEVFPGWRVVQAYSIKLTRDAELYIDDEFSGNLLEKIKKSLAKRETGFPCRFLYDSKIPKNFLNILRNAVGLSKEDLIPGAKYHNFNDFFSFPNLGPEKLNYDLLLPVKSNEFTEGISIFESITRKDIMLNFPYHSYDHVINFLEEASKDENVKSIKITLYRTANNSRVIKALTDAAKNGKNVTAFVEVKARFDEESNLENAEELERAGVRVLYSFPGLKVHSKICLVNRMENGLRKYYGYVATGNFNEKTARIYSDLGIFTANDLLTLELRKVFYYLSKKSEKENFERLLVSPFNLREKINDLIEREIQNAAEGKEAWMILKANSLEDKKIIKKIYEASQEGVKVSIIVRGICCLIPGIKDLSSNIKAISIVDRFLEHTRIFVFCSGGDNKYFISSADLMTRNLDRRIELCFPVYDLKIQKDLRKILNLQLNDNLKARKIGKSQKNKYIKLHSEAVRSQYAAYEYFRDNKEGEKAVSADLIQIIN
ncbi:MAG TPA: polyphosphate kinase 1 [Ignavibacteriaceae bacterium]|nr:polyphosphate kinase 1 [Ignavibacteriaceae bacterium]